MKTWIKFCAQTNLQDALASFECGADAIGFVFAESKRQVTAAQVKAIVRELPASGEKIGVFANESAQRIAAIVSETGLTGVQLQGEESVTLVKELRALLPANVTITKTLHANLLRDDVSKWGELVSAILLDSGTAHERGGTGQTFDWQVAVPFARQLQQQTRVIVAGGLRPENVAEAIHIFHPYGVDVATGIESAPGKKDLMRMKKFVETVRAAEARMVTAR